MLLELRKESPKTVRKNKLVPGVVYGKDFGPISVQVDEKEFINAYRTFGKNLPFAIKLEGNEYQVHIKDVQFDTFRHNDPIHFDLLRITSDTLISAEISVNIIGREEIERGRTFIELTLSEIPAEYSVENAIASIDFDVSKLKIGDVVYVKDLNIPDTINVLVDEDTPILSVKEAAVVVEEEEETTDSENDDSDKTE